MGRRASVRSAALLIGSLLLVSPVAGCTGPPVRATGTGAASTTPAARTDSTGTKPGTGTGPGASVVTTARALGGGPLPPSPTRPATRGPTTTATTPLPPVPPATGTGLPGMPPVTNPHDVYAAAGANLLLPRVRRYPAYAYVPQNKSGDVWVIDQRTHAVVRKCHVGIEIQHVVPSYDLRMLYATDDLGDVIREIDPATGRCGRTIKVRDPYNMYFSPDGRYAISVAEDYKQLIWYDPVRWQVRAVTPVPECAGVDHADFSADGRTAVFTCEFAGRVIVVDVEHKKVLRTVDMTVRNTMMGPQDIKLAPDARSWYVADSDSNGVWVLDGGARKVLRHITTGRGAHGLYLSRDARRLYVTNRLEGSISVLDARSGRPLTKWWIPNGGSPDMGNVSADGTKLWLSGRYDNVVYVLSTANGKLLARIPVGNGPHGLALMPLPGRYSLGHTGITR